MTEYAYIIPHNPDYILHGYMRGLHSISHFAQPEIRRWCDDNLSQYKLERRVTTEHQIKSRLLNFDEKAVTVFVLVIVMESHRDAVALQLRWADSIQAFPD